jgi:hypothetical protein
MKLANLETIPQQEISALASAGIVTTDDLLTRAATPAGRAGLTQATGVAASTLERLVGMADLMRISGIAEPHAALLAALEIPTVAALAGHEAPILIKQMRRKNVELLLARAMPPESTVARWIADAKNLPPLALACTGYLG